jgi:hypothetical protein
MANNITDEQMLMFHSAPHEPGFGSVSICNFDPGLIASLKKNARVDLVLRTIFRVAVARTERPEVGNVPAISGRHQILEDALRFTPHFPFERGIHYRALFDPRTLNPSQYAEVQALEFSLPEVQSASAPTIKNIFPSIDSLPENLLRFYVCFSKSMQHGRAAENIQLLGPDGQPAPDVLYRPPVELWDRSMQQLTILLDPGRLKRRVGPNRKLGPPLMAGQKYTLAVGSGMVDASGRTLGETFYKSFHVTEPIREPIAVEEWKLLPPKTNSHEPLTLAFPAPLDWALLLRKITVVSEDGQLINGRITLYQDEKCWNFSPQSLWNAGSYCVRISPSLEDVCGNNLMGAFDRPLRPGSDLMNETVSRSLRFNLA